MQVILIILIVVILWPLIVPLTKLIMVTIAAALVYVASTAAPDPTNIFGIQSGMSAHEASRVMMQWFDAGKAEDYTASQKDDIMTSFRSLNNATYMCGNSFDGVGWFYLQLEWRDYDGVKTIKIPSFTCDAKEVSK